MMVDAANRPQPLHQQQPIRQQRYYYDFIPTIDVLSDGSELTNTTLFLSIWRRRKPRNSLSTTTTTTTPQCFEGNNNNNNNNNNNHLEVLVRRYALTGLTNSLARLAADQRYSLSTIQTVFCPLIRSTNHTTSMSTTSASTLTTSEALEGLASLLLALHRGGTLDNFTVVLTPSSTPTVTTTHYNSEADLTYTTITSCCPVEQIAKLVLSNKPTISNCPIRTCHVPPPPALLLSSASPTSTSTLSQEQQQQQQQQPWWKVYDDELLVVHTKTIPTIFSSDIITSLDDERDVVLIFWYTFWCCDGAKHHNNNNNRNGSRSSSRRNSNNNQNSPEKAAAAPSTTPYNLGVVIMSNEYSGQQIQEWFRDVPEHNILPSSPSPSLSSLNTLLLVGPLSSVSPLSFSWVPQVLFTKASATTTATATTSAMMNVAHANNNNNNNSNNNGLHCDDRILFRKAYQEALWLKSKFPNHIFMSSTSSSLLCQQQHHHHQQQQQQQYDRRVLSPAATTVTFPSCSSSSSIRTTSVIRLVSGTSVVLPSSRVIDRRQPLHPNNSPLLPRSSSRRNRNNNNNGNNNHNHDDHQFDNSIPSKQELQYEQQVKDVQEALQDYLTSSTTAASIDHNNNSNDQQQQQLQFVKDENVIDLCDSEYDDASSESIAASIDHNSKDQRQPVKGSITASIGHKSKDQRRQKQQQQQFVEEDENVIDLCDSEDDASSESIAASFGHNSKDQRQLATDENVIYIWDSEEEEEEEDVSSEEESEHETSGDNNNNNNKRSYNNQQPSSRNMLYNGAVSSSPLPKLPDAPPPATYSVAVPHLLVLGTGCASPSSFRGSSGYGLFLPHVNPNASTSTTNASTSTSSSPSSPLLQSDVDCHIGLHLVLTAVLECGGDFVSQLYRFLPPPPPPSPPISDTAQSPTYCEPDQHHVWFQYQLRQIRFIWISHAHLDHFEGIPTLLRHIHEAHYQYQQRQDEPPPIYLSQRAKRRRKRKKDQQQQEGYSNLLRPLVIAPPKVLEYLQALSIPSYMYDGVSQFEYGCDPDLQRWITDITLTTTTITSNADSRSTLDKPSTADHQMHDQNYCSYRPFAFLRHVCVDHNCFDAYGLYLGLSHCLWYPQQQRGHQSLGDHQVSVLCFSGDTRPCCRLVKQTAPSSASWRSFTCQPVQAAQTVDWLIHEATFDHDEQKMAHAKGHSTSRQALDVAEQMNAKLCLLTHFSQRYHNAIPYALPSSGNKVASPHETLGNRQPKVLFAFDGLFLPLLL